MPTTPESLSRTLPDDDQLIAESEALALAMLQRAEQITSRSERGRARRLSALLSDDKGRDLLLDLTDQVLLQAESVRRCP
jgi:hypothetical protein